MEQKTKRKPKKNTLEEIAALEQEVVSLRKRADTLEAKAHQRLIELTCSTMVTQHGAFNSKAFAAVFPEQEEGQADEPETNVLESGE